MNNKWAAYNLFGSMRSSISQEHKEYEEMLKRYSVPFERSIFNMGDIEIGYCDICHNKTQVTRQYYHYDINCECCGGPHHFEIVKYCKECKPRPPKYINAEVIPIEEQSRFNPENWEYYD